MGFLDPPPPPPPFAQGVSSWTQTLKFLFEFPNPTSLRQFSIITMALKKRFSTWNEWRNESQQQHNNDSNGTIIYCSHHPSLLNN